MFASSLPFGVQGVPRLVIRGNEDRGRDMSSLPFGVQGVPRDMEHRSALHCNGRSSLPFGVQGVPRHRQPGLLQATGRLVFIAFRRSGRSPPEVGTDGLVGRSRRLHCLSAFRAFPAKVDGKPVDMANLVFIAFRRSGRSPRLFAESTKGAEIQSLHCLSAFRAFPAHPRPTV